ncbi:glutathione synthase [Shewanella sp. NIFS-20-20]|uniref:glutathione synthase n=1 Tax=Shewanella sp. NIFS-20-20 TaxID=2853806 RepID=UPI001C496ECF|nr:glutathione synthase [Shewanella sp. NIFS-20-20]MBV7315371.1 glutathione synthase [Shewanella sp. NIFS-20-20]
MNTIFAAKKEPALLWALTHGMAFRSSTGSASHVPFSLSPSQISPERFHTLQDAGELMAMLIDNLSRQDHILDAAISPIVAHDPLFAALLEMHRQLYQSTTPPPRVPLLILRSDFLDDSDFGTTLVEANSIAAGMGPFGQLTHQLHQHLQQRPAAPELGLTSSLVENPAIERLATAIAAATMNIKQAFNDQDPPRFLMVVQPDEDNVFDQFLLEQALQQRGIDTLRRTFSELQGQLSTGPQQRLMLAGVGSLDTVYLRSGYQYDDYSSPSSSADLMAIRVFIERHRVAVSATVSQQLASSKRMQMLLSQLPASALTQFGLSQDQAAMVKPLLGEIIAVNEQSIAKVKADPSATWVLKDQREGGGHCLFDTDIITKLAQLSSEEYPAWLLMRRLHPRPANAPAYIVRHGKLEVIDDLVAEIGIFNVWYDGQPCPLEPAPPLNTPDITDSMPANQAPRRPNAHPSFAGYLVRSKSAQTTEAGVHSGRGVLDSLMFSFPS